MKHLVFQLNSSLNPSLHQRIVIEAIVIAWLLNAVNVEGNPVWCSSGGKGEVVFLGTQHTLATQTNWIVSKACSHHFIYFSFEQKWDYDLYLWFLEMVSSHPNTNPFMWGLFHKPWNKDSYQTTSTMDSNGHGFWLLLIWAPQKKSGWFRFLFKHHPTWGGNVVHVRHAINPPSCGKKGGGHS